MKEAVKHYEAALKAAFPNGQTGTVVLYHWNEARASLEQQAQQEPVAWEGITSIKYPNGTPRLIFTDKQTAEEWLGNFVDGVAWLAPLYTTPTQHQIK